MYRRNFLAAVGVLACSVGALAAQDGEKQGEALHREPLNYIYDNDLRHNYVTDNFVTENEMTGWRTGRRHTTGEIGRASCRERVSNRV